MMEHRADKYECVKKYPILRGYLEHFNGVSKNNEIPGLISFFYILGQASIPYVRIPVDGSNLDPRVSIFWIQDTRTGKSAAYQHIEKVIDSCSLETNDYNSGNDAALVGTLVPDPDFEGPVRDAPQIPRPGVLAGRKGLNFDEGSVILKSGQHNENTTLFLQSALNSAGTGRNYLTKHMARDSFTVKSEAHFFNNLQKSLKRRVQELADIPPLEWDEMNEDDQEQVVMDLCCNRKVMFTIDESYIPALMAAIDEYYAVVEKMSPDKQSICSSFIMGLQNYTNILAHHMAMIEGSWVVTGDHIDMAKEMLFDLYQNLIQWLESEVNIGAAASEKKKMQDYWVKAYNQSELFDFDDQRGFGWAKKKEVMDTFGRIANYSSHASINDKFKTFADEVFDTTREGVRVFVRLKKEYKKGGKAK